MPEINQTLDDLLTIYRAIFAYSEHDEAICKNLVKSLPAARGVYLIWRKSDKKLLYIGSSGKINNGNSLSGTNVKIRMSGSTTPYRLDGGKNCLWYLPTTAGVPPAGYKNAVTLSDIRIAVLTMPNNFAPTVLEHLLIQGHFNQFNSLPEANQKI